MIILLLLILGVLAGAGLLIYSKFYSHTLTHSADARQFVEELVPQIVEHWDVEVLRTHSTPAFNQVVSPENMARLFHDLQKLGAVQKIGEAQGRVRDSLDGTIVGTFQVETQFEHDRAVIEVQVFYVKNEWRVNGFRVQQENLKL